MKNLFLLLVTTLLLFSCKKSDALSVEKSNSTDTSSEKKIGKEFEMYTMSPMAVLMEQMYIHNETTKKKISKGEDIVEFPDYFLTIHTSKFTDETDNDAFFKSNAALFIEAQRKLYSEANNVKENYNLGIDACITCHEKKCGGPIPRIKKLYIK